MPSNQVAYGMTLRNFVAYPELPDPADLIEQGVWIEQLGFESAWVWDHILLGVEPHFPIIDSLTLLTAIAARTRTVKLGTGVLILPLRNPVILAKQLSSMDVISGGRLLLGLQPRALLQGHRGVRLLQVVLLLLLSQQPQLPQPLLVLLPQLPHPHLRLLRLRPGLDGPQPRPGRT